MLLKSVSILEEICIGIVGGFGVDKSVAEGKLIPTGQFGRDPLNTLLDAGHNRVKQRGSAEKRDERVWESLML